MLGISTASKRGMSGLLLQAGGLCLQLFGIPDEARSVRFVGKSCRKVTGSARDVPYPIDLF